MPSSTGRNDKSAKSGRDWFGWLVSPRGIVTAAVVLGLASGAATAAAAMDALSSKGALRRLVEILEVGDAFRSWWYSLALIFAGTVSMAVFLDGWRRLRSPGSAPVRLRSKVKTSASVLEVMPILGGSRRSVRELDDGRIVAERGRLRRYARVLGGSGGLLLVAGIAIGLYLGEYGVVQILEGSSSYSFLRKSVVGSVRADLGAELQVQRRPSAPGRPQRWRLEMARGADILSRAELAIGEGTTALGRRVRLQSAEPGTAPRAFRVVIGDSAPRLLTAGEKVEAERGTEVAVVGYDPNLLGKYGPAIRVAWIRRDKRAEVGWVLGRYPEFDRQVRRSRPPIRFAGFVPRTELRIVIQRSAGRWLLVLGALVLLLSLLSLAAPPYSRILAEPTAEGWRIDASGDGDVHALTEDVEQLESRLRSIGPDR